MHGRCFAFSPRHQNGPIRAPQSGRVTNAHTHLLQKSADSRNRESNPPSFVAQRFVPSSDSPGTSLKIFWRLLRWRIHAANGAQTRGLPCGAARRRRAGVDVRTARVRRRRQMGSTRPRAPAMDRRAVTDRRDDQRRRVGASLLVLVGRPAGSVVSARGQARRVCG